MRNPLAIVLAAGKGTRMKSDLPKVLAPVCGRPMIEFVLEALAAANIGRQVVVIGYRGQDVRQALAGRPGLEFVEQAQQLGTGHAVAACRPLLAPHVGPVLVVTGDSPLIQPASIRRLLDEFEQARPACLLGTLHKEKPAGLGRIVRDGQGQFAAIVEERDADERQRQITEVNMSTYVFECRDLLLALDELGSNNRQGEYYLTDCPGILRRHGRPVLAMPILLPCEALSINSLDELAAVERELMSRQR